MEKRITCMDDYHKLKKIIYPHNPEQLIINSLSFIGMEKDDE